MSKKNEINFVPAPGIYCVKEEEALEQTLGGILIPDKAQDKPMEGVVVTLGEFKAGDGPIWKVKDHVLYKRYSGHEINVDGVIYMLLEADDILGKRV